MAIQQITRKPLLNASLRKRTITSVDLREITFAAGQQTGRHRHPCPVVGFVAGGAALLEVEGQQPQLPTGSSFYEPADTVILRFDNASSTAPMKFIAHYLLNGTQDLIEVLPATDG
jgi:quercetin dioxygenase-like cupin family protein